MVDYINKKMKKPYLKLYKKIGPYKAWIVDGFYIRNNMDEEFTNCATFYEFKFVPKNELWIDKESNRGEEKYYVNYMLYFLKEIKKGKSYSEAVKIAEKIEKVERKKILLSKKAYKKISYKNIIKKIYKRVIFKNKKIKIWLVNGEIVRDLFFIDFTEGGHDKVYNFIPEKEVWIDDDLSIKERKFVILHELHERNLMSGGWDYNTAHYNSSSIEFDTRHNVKKLNDRIKKELRLINN